MNGRTCVWNPIVREQPHPLHTSPARWRTAKWSDRDHRRAKSPSARDIADVTDEADSLRMNLRQAKHALATRDEETRRLRAAVTHLESTLAQRERELRDTVLCLRGECPPRPHQEWLQEGTPTSRLRLQVHKLQRVAAAKQDHIEHLNRQASLGFLREAREQADEYRIEARRLARTLAAITADNVRQSDTPKSGNNDFGQDWGHNRLGQSRTTTVAGQQPRSQPVASNPQNVHRPSCPAPHRTADAGGYGDTGGKLRSRPTGESWQLMMRKCLGDRSREGSLPWGSIGRGAPPATAPTGDRCAAWRDEIPYDSLGLRPPLSSAARLTGAGKTVVPSSAAEADGVYGSNLHGRKSGLSRMNTRRASGGIECWGSPQRHFSRGSSRPFDENARTSSMACSARLRSSAQQRTAERNIALALDDESRRLKAAREERKRTARLARQKIARYRAERLRELESRHARSCGTRSPQLHRQTSATHQQQPPSNSGRGDEKPSKGEAMSCASDDRSDKAHDYDNPHDSKQRRAVKAALAAALEAASYVGEEYPRSHATEDEPSRVDEKGGIECRDGSPYGLQRRLRGSGADGGEAAETWHGPDCGDRDYGSPTAWSIGKPLGKPPLAPSRTVPSKTPSSQQGPSEVTDGRDDGTDGDGGARKRYTWEETSDADEVQTEVTSGNSERDAGEPWRDEEEQDDDSVWEENMSANWEEHSAAGGGGGVPAPVQDSRMGTGTVVNPGKSCRGQPDRGEPRHGNNSGRSEGSSRHGRDKRDVGHSGGLTRGAGLRSGVPCGKRRQFTESEQRRSSAPEPSTYFAPALPVTAMGECVPGEDPPVASYGSREKTRVRGGNVGGTGNVPRRNIKSGQMTTSGMVETNESIGRGGQYGRKRGTSAIDHRGSSRGEDEEYMYNSGSVTRAEVPPDGETIGRSTVSQARGEGRAQTDNLRFSGEGGASRDDGSATDNPRVGSEGRKARDVDLATRERVGNAYAVGEEREDRKSSRGEEMDDDDSYNSRWSLSAEDVTQGQGASLVPETSVGEECIGDVTVSVPEYQDDFFEGSARQDQGTDISFAVSPPSEEETEAFGAAPSSASLPVISAAPPPNHQTRPNFPSGDPTDDDWSKRDSDDWLIREPPTMTANKTRLGENPTGRRNVRRPRSAGGNKPNTRPDVSPPIPRFSTKETCEMEGGYSAPVHALSEEEKEAGRRKTSARISTTAFVYGEDEASSGATTGGRQRLAQEEDPPTTVGGQLMPSLVGGEQQPQSLRNDGDLDGPGSKTLPPASSSFPSTSSSDIQGEAPTRGSRLSRSVAKGELQSQTLRDDDGHGESANSKTSPPTSSPLSPTASSDMQGEPPTTVGSQFTLSLPAEEERQPQSLRNAGDLDGSASKKASPAASSLLTASSDIQRQPPTVGSKITPLLVEGEQKPHSLRDDDDLGRSTSKIFPPASSSFPTTPSDTQGEPQQTQSLRDDDGLGGPSNSKTLPPVSSFPTDIQGQSPPTVGGQLTPLLTEREQQQSQAVRVFEGGAGSLASRPTLSSRSVWSEESHADSSVDLFQATSSREGGSSTRTTVDDSTINAQIGTRGPDDGRGSSAASVAVTGELSAAGEQERSPHSSGSVLDGSGGGIDTAADNDDGYF